MKILLNKIVSAYISKTCIWLPKTDLISVRILLLMRAMWPVATCLTKKKCVLEFLK